MSTRPRAMFAACTIVVALSAAACGSSGRASAPRPVSPTAAANAVVIDTFMFMPKRVHVHVGDTVTWTNRDSILHTVTSGAREYDPSDSGRVTATHKDGMFDMQLDGKGATAKFTFTRAGTFHYFCNRHPGMEADIDVS